MKNPATMIIATKKLLPAFNHASASRQPSAVGGLAGWLLSRFSARPKPRPKLAILERLTLAPRQTVCLVEAEGRKFLIATSSAGTPALYPLDNSHPPTGRLHETSNRLGRVSW